MKLRVAPWFLLAFIGVCGYAGFRWAFSGGSTEGKGPAHSASLARTPPSGGLPVVDASDESRLPHSPRASTRGSDVLSTADSSDGLFEEGSRSEASSVQRSTMMAPSEASLLENGTGLRQDAAFQALASEPLAPFLRRLEGDAGPVASALAFEYRNGVVATLPRDGAQLRHMACGSSLCVLDIWFPDEASRDGWSETAFGPGGLPEGGVQLAYSMPQGRGWQYRAMFSVDPQVRAIVVPSQRPPGG